MKFPKNLIERNHYIDRIKPYMKQNVVKVLTGQRRVGKSYILYQLIRLVLKENSQANIIYLNMEDFENIRLKNAENLYTRIKDLLHEGEMNYIFLDEIQDVDHWEDVIRSLATDDDNDIYITGSNSKMLSSELSTYLSGRYVEFPIYSLSYVEFLQFHHREDSDESLRLYERYGGLPYLINLRLDDDTVNEYLNSIYSTIVFRDIVERYKLRNIDFLERLIEYLAENIGNLFSAKKVSDFLKSQQVKISVTQIQNYLQYLANAFLIQRVERYDLVGKRMFEIGEKDYFENLGLRNNIIGYRFTDEGKLLENMVFNQLLYLGYQVKIGYMQQKEIDFVAEKNHERIYIQVSLRLDNEETIEREFGNLLSLNDNYPKIVVTRDAFQGNTYQGIHQMSIRELLMKTSL
ncbi:MAG: ATP-binding protein [Prevotellaceae bacterium]|nr:ATP-binding protein [Prevotellaceae bacterium]